MVDSTSTLVEQLVQDRRVPRLGEEGGDLLGHPRADAGDLLELRARSPPGRRRRSRSSVPGRAPRSRRPPGCPGRRGTAAGSCGTPSPGSPPASRPTSRRSPRARRAARPAARRGREAGAPDPGRRRAWRSRRPVPRRPAPARAKWTMRPASCAGHSKPLGQTVNGPRSTSGVPQEGQTSGMRHSGARSRSGVASIALDHLRDDVAGPLHAHAVALAHVLPRHLLAVVEGGARHGDAADLDRQHEGDRRHHAGAADARYDRQDAGDLLARRELEGEGPARVARGPAQPVAGGEVVELDRPRRRSRSRGRRGAPGGRRGRRGPRRRSPPGAPGR